MSQPFTGANLSVLFVTIALAQAIYAQRAPAPRRDVPERPAPTRPGEIRQPIADQLPTARFKVGDRVVLKLMLSDRHEFNLAAQRGKIVLIDFWMSTELGRAHLGELLPVHSRFADKGLVVVGVSGDRQLSDAESVMREMAIPWPLHWNGYWRDSKVFTQFGVPALPRVAIIGPDGTLLYMGRGSKVDEEVEKAFLNHPPFARDQVAMVIDSLKEANRAMDDGDVLAGYRTYATLPPGLRNDPAVTKRANDLRYRLVNSTEAAFKAIDDLIAQSQFVDAATSLKSIGTSLNGMTPQAEATRRLEDLLARPEVKEQVAKAEREANAATALAAARTLRDAGSDLAAYERFRAVSMDYAETAAAGDALIAVKAYDADPIFTLKRRDAIAAPKAEPALQNAENLRRNGRSDLARRKLQDVIDSFPNTTFADKAKKALDGLPPPT